MLAFAWGAPRPARAEEPKAAPSDAAPASSPVAPLVVIDSTRSFTAVERRANHVLGWSLTLPFPAYVSTEQWEPVCVAPCSLRLDPNAIYRVGGGGVAPSGAFALPHGGDPLRLHVHAGSSFLHDGGIVLTVLGAGSVLAGIAIAGASTAAADPAGTVKAGAVFFAPGALALVVGAVLWLTNGSSVVADDGTTL
jgi:hypothetical protein